MERTSFGGTLRALRKGKRLSQAKLAELAQVSVRSILYWETGQYIPSEPELGALLTTLEVPVPEQARLILNLPAQYSEKILHNQNLLDTPIAMTMPSAGDLLGALRGRQGLTREQAARSLGLAVTTWARWENNHYRIPDDILPRIQTLLKASPAEIQAIRQRLTPLPEEDVLFSVEQVGHWTFSFARQRYTPGMQTVDLDALALQRRLWRYYTTHPEARIPLALVSLDYAAWLASQHRLTSAFHQAQQALQLYAMDNNPPLSIAGTLGLLSVVRSSPIATKDVVAASRRGIALLNDWLPRIGRPTTRAMLLANLGLLSAQLAHYDVAHRYFQSAQTTLDRSREDTEHIARYIMLSRASVLLNQKRPVEALLALPEAIPDPVQTAPEIGNYQFLMYARLMLDHGEYSLADLWVSKIYAGLDQVDIPGLRTRADEIARQL